jgi:uncharacterized protein
MRPNQDERSGLKIRISGLSPGTHEYSFSVAPSDIQLDKNFNAPVEVAVQLEKTANEIYVRSRVHAGGEFQCDRCLDDFTQDISCQYSQLYVFDEADAGRDVDGEARVVHGDTTVIDLSADVREMIILSVPLKLLCREECRGLCSACGTDLNTGSCDCREETVNRPWQGLEKLLKN